MAKHKVEVGRVGFRHYNATLHKHDRKGRLTERTDVKVKNPKRFVKPDGSPTRLARAVRKYKNI
jgi:hypothetical protein